MFKKEKSKRIILSSLVAIMLVGSVAFAAGEIWDKKITATHGRIKLSYEGKDVTKKVEEMHGAPAFTVKEYDSRAYVPVRAIGELMGLDVSYDNTTHTAHFNDFEKADLKKQVKAKDLEIAKLKEENKKLKEDKNEDKNKDKDTDKNKDKLNDLKSLEKQLNKDYGLTNNVYFDINLKEYKNRISVDLIVDLRDPYERNDWKRMNVRKKEDMIQDIVDDINKVFKGYRVDGGIYDNYNKRTLLDFVTSTSGRVILTDRDYIQGELEDDARYYIEDGLSRLGEIKSTNIRERGTGEIYGTVTFEDRGVNKEPRDKDLDNELYYAEDSLINRFGSGIYLEIDVYYGSRRLGSYYNGKWSSR